MRNSTWSLPAYDEPVFEDIMCKLEEGKCLPVDKFLLAELDKIPGSTWKDKLDSCAACKCCYRHQVKKPLTFAPWAECVSSSFALRDDCECDCRHMARWICRQAPKRPQVEYPM